MRYIRLLSVSGILLKLTISTVMNEKLITLLYVCLFTIVTANTKLFLEKLLTTVHSDQ